MAAAKRTGAGFVARRSKQWLSKLREALEADPGAGVGEVHCVQAFGKLQEVVQSEAPFPHGFILHSWAGNAEQVKQFSRMEGVYFSISGHTFNLSAKKLQPMLQQIPEDRLLLETDAPDGLPQADEAQALDPSASDGDRMRLNQPANIRVVLELFSKATGRDKATCARMAYKNAASIFLR